MAEATAAVSPDVTICYETFGSTDDPAMLLVMGLAGPMNWWDTQLCEALAAHGYYVIRYDNRDTGRSTVLHEYRVGRADLVRAALGDRRIAPYGIADLAADAWGLLDALRIERVHIVGISMGGMIAQTMAVERPSRVRSLTSMMSTTGNRLVGWPHPRLLPSLLRPAGRTREEYVVQAMRTQRMISSPGYPASDTDLRELAEETYERGRSASGVLRQILAILSQPDRTRALRELDVAACVLHGLDDPLVDVSGGRATALAISGSELILVPGLAHDLPSGLYPTFVDAIVRTTERGRTADAQPQHGTR